jgi:predicted Zn finger-like uncharacterized protein
MILTCPECATRYFVDDHKLGPAGRTVRCASCGNAWKTTAEEPLELTDAEPRTGKAGEPLSFKPLDGPVELTAPELPKAFRARAEQRRKLRDAAVSGVVWAGVACGFAGLLLGAYVFRVDVVKLYPRTASAYAMAGLPVNPTGLEFEGVKATPAPDGLAAVTVSGLIRNVEDSSSAPPPIRVAIVDKAGVKLANTVISLPATPLAPGQTRSFSVSLPDPDASAAGVDVAFALDLAPPRAPKARPAAKPAPAPLRVAQANAPVAVPAPTHAPAQASAPAPAAPVATRAKLRPAMGVEPRVATEEAKPLSAGDPYALDSIPGRTVSAAPHG